VRVFNDGEHDWYEVDKDVYICALDYPEAVRQRKEFGYGWSLDHLRSIGLGPFEFVGFQPYPKKGKT
jgi:hypothetical protein